MLRPEARHQVGDVVHHHETHLALRQDRCLGMSCRVFNGRGVEGLACILFDQYLPESFSGTSLVKRHHTFHPPSCRERRIGVWRELGVIR
jgi:hypothetical protein